MRVCIGDWSIVTALLWIVGIRIIVPAKQGHEAVVITAIFEQFRLRLNLKIRAPNKATRLEALIMQTYRHKVRR